MNPAAIDFCLSRIAEAPSVAVLKSTWAAFGQFTREIAVVQNAYNTRLADLSKETRA